MGIFDKILKGLGFEGENKSSSTKIKKQIKKKAGVYSLDEEKEEIIDEMKPKNQEEVAKIVDFLKKEGINAVICGQIGSAGRNLMRTRRIELTYGAFGNADDVMIRYLSGERLGDLEENTLWSLTGREEEDFAQ